jgi:serine/threonine protein phosphatase PrpC
MARQDSYTAFTTKDFLVVAIADGVSSSTNSHFGAQLVTRELQSVFSEYISKENVGMSSSWMGLNQQLSKQLVRVHANNLKIAGQPIPDSLNQLREAAADSLATTLEILVVELQKNSDSSSNYIYVNIAGDGSLYQLHEGLIHELNPDKSEVFALPASDKEPLILSGKMSPNTALALCTDGIGAYILKDQSWAEMMIEVASESRPTYAKLIDFITFRSPGALDDQTIILTSFK